MKFDKEYIYKISKDIFDIDSPVFYTKHINEYIINILKEYKFDYKVYNKDTIEVFLQGKSKDKIVATSAHLDTLGLMVRSISPKGRLNIVSIGGVSTPTIDGTNCRIITRKGKVYTGTILSKSSSTHVYEDARTLPRTIDNLEVRIDSLVKNKEDVIALGIQNGDYIAIDTNFKVENDFIKSRFIDNKICVSILLHLLKDIYEKKLELKYDTRFYFTNQEEIGHGGSIISKEICEFVALDMGCVGKDLDGDETKVSICAKDAQGPYSYDLTNHLILIADNCNIDYVVDIYPFYGSDVGASWRAGCDLKGALIGPGVDSSHGYERTHIKGVENTYNLLLKYLKE